MLFVLPSNLQVLREVFHEKLEAPLLCRFGSCSAAAAELKVVQAERIRVHQETACFSLYHQMLLITDCHIVILTSD